MFEDLGQAALRTEHPSDVYLRTCNQIYRATCVLPLYDPGGRLDKVAGLHELEIAQRRLSQTGYHNAKCETARVLQI
jgi:hypothetical protein